MTDSEPITEIKFSKYHALLSVIFPLAFYESIRDLLIQGRLNHNYTWYLLFAFVLWLMWRYFIRFTVFMLIGKPAIIITKTDVTFNELGYTIDWCDIDSMEIVVTSGKSTSYHLVMEVKDAWKYISTVKNPVLRYYRWYAKDYFYEPFRINLGIIEGDNYEIFETVQNAFHQYKRPG